MTMPVFTIDTLYQLMPLVVLLVGGLGFMLAGALTPHAGPLQRGFALATLFVTLLYVFKLWNADAGPILHGMLIMDRFALFFIAIVIICALGTVLISNGYLDRFGLNRGEFFSMVFFSAMGMGVLVSAYDLISIFLGIELMSLAVYVLVAFRRRDLFSNEAAIKYFIIGAFAIAFYLFGVSLIYGLCGSTNFEAIVSAVATRNLAQQPIFLLAVGLILAALGFKVSSVPFHMWTPDVYQGAPTPITSFMATAVKAASFAAFLRLFYACFMASRDQWVGVIVVLAILTMTLGNMVALVQRNLKRMLAYSSIAHAGYILVGMAAISADDTKAASAVMYYTLTYAFMTLGAFAVVGLLERRGDPQGLEGSDYAGLGLRRPFVGLCMSAFMFALAGIPPTAGFFGKYYVFSAAVEQGFVTLAVIGVLNSAVSLYYYLRVVVSMYMQSSDEPAPTYDDYATRFVLLVSLAAVVWLGIGPSGWIPGVESVLEWTRASLESVIELSRR